MKKNLKNFYTNYLKKYIESTDLVDQSYDYLYQV